MLLTTKSGDTVNSERVSRYIAKVMNEMTPTTGDFDVTEVAQKVYAQLQENAPDILETWLEQLAQRWLHESLAGRLRSQRSYFRSQVKRSDFAEALADGTLSPFDLVEVCNEAFLRRRVADMTKADHLFVAKSKNESSKRDALEAAFHQAVAKRIPLGKTTQDVMDESQYTKLYNSIVGEES